MRSEPMIMSPRERCYFTPILWAANPELETGAESEWHTLRTYFTAARRGQFSVLDDLPRLYPQLQDPAARLFARNLLGDAGTDAQLEAVEAFILDSPLDITNVCELCHSLGLWGRLSAVEAILTAYDRNFPGQCVESIPGYLTTMLEPEFGPAANYPRDDSLDAFNAYEIEVRSLLQTRLQELGGPKAYASFGGAFSVGHIAERMLQSIGSTPHEIMMRPFLRQRFEASTGIDCTDFYHDTDFQPLTAAAKLEAWLSSQEPARFALGERYFFGYRIPR